MKKIVMMILALGLIFGTSGVSTLAVESGEWELSEIQMQTAATCVGSCVAEGKLYITGGAVTSVGGGHTSTVYAYDFETRTWAQKKNMPATSSYHATVYLDGKIYTIGGYQNGAGTVSAVYAYDIAADTWATMAALPEKLCQMSAVVVDGKIYACGGSYRSIGNGLPNRISSALYVYSPENNTWTKKTDMLTPSSSGYSKLVHYNGYLYFFGGTGLNTQSTVPSSCQRYNITYDYWEKIAEMPLGRHDTAIVSIDSDVYIIAGSSNLTTTCNEVQKYSIDTNSWEQVESYPINTSGLGAEVYEGQIYAFGGFGGSNRVKTVYIYTPATSALAKPQLSVHINVGEQVQLSMTGDLADNTKFLWSSSKTSVAVINEKGVVTGVSTGRCNITVGNQTISIRVDDAQEGETVYQKTNDDNSQIVYSGAWLSYSDPAFYNGDEHYSSQPNAYAEFSFTGTSVRWIGATSDNLGKCNVYIDGELAESGLDLYSSSLETQKILFSKTGLSNGPHTIKIVVTGEKNVQASDCNVTIDAFEFLQ